MLGIWNDRDNNEEGDLANARIYQRVHLDAGRYYFGNTFQTRYNLLQAYLFAAEEPVATSEMETTSLAWRNISNGGDDSKYNGIYFTLDEPKDVCLGFQANLADGSSAQEFRADKVVLYGYSIDTGIDDVQRSSLTVQRPTYYTLSGVRLQQPPTHGFYIVRQGNTMRKVMAK